MERVDGVSAQVGWEVEGRAVARGAATQDSRISSMVNFTMVAGLVVCGASSLSLSALLFTERRQVFLARCDQGRFPSRRPTGACRRLGRRICIWDPQDRISTRTPPGIRLSKKRGPSTRHFYSNGIHRDRTAFCTLQERPLSSGEQP